MINGRSLHARLWFCLVDTRKPSGPPDPAEAVRVADAVVQMGLKHAVVTAVARDDLPDGGAAAFAAVISAVRRRSLGTAVEVLIPDCKGDPAALDTIFRARPDVLNHNVETVPRLQFVTVRRRQLRSQLAVWPGKTADSHQFRTHGVPWRSGGRVIATMRDLRSIGVDIVTIGQYLRPTIDHLPVVRWWTPDEFDTLRIVGQSMGFRHVQSSPLTRSSYHAREAATV